MRLAFRRPCPPLRSDRVGTRRPSSLRRLQKTDKKRGRKRGFRGLRICWGRIQKHDLLRASLRQRGHVCRGSTPFRWKSVLLVQPSKHSTECGCPEKYDSER